jgi:hypothetical protein
VDGTCASYSGGSHFKTLPEDGATLVRGGGGVVVVVFLNSFQTLLQIIDCVTLCGNDQFVIIILCCILSSIIHDVSKDHSALPGKF